MSSRCCSISRCRPAFLGDAHARRAVDPPDHYSARAAAGVGRTVPVSVASQLCGRYRRDRRAAAGAGAAVAHRHFHDPQRGGSSDPHPRRKPRPRRIARNHGACGAMIAPITEPCTEPYAEPGEARAATWLGFILMCLGMFMAILDIQVVATSLPSIQHALAISRDAMSWIQTAYLIAEITAIPLTGLLTRVLTLRWLFAIAISVFTLASIGCAFSGDFPTLVSFRVLRGFAGGTLIPAVFSAVFLLFPVRLHPIATTLAGIVAVLAPTIGPVVGGWITETWSWHWLFLINVAPGVIAAAATPFLLPRASPRFADLVTLDRSSLTL